MLRQDFRQAHVVAHLLNPNLQESHQPLHVETAAPLRFLRWREAAGALGLSKEVTLAPEPVLVVELFDSVFSEFQVSLRFPRLYVAKDPGATLVIFQVQSSRAKNGLAPE